MGLSPVPSRHRVEAADAVAPIRYEASLTSDGETLLADIEIPAGPGTRLTVPTPARPFVTGVEAQADGRWRPLGRDDIGWTLSDHAASARVRYRFLLGRAANEVRDVDLAARAGSAIVAPPSTWLLRPSSKAAIPFRLHLSTAGDRQFVSALPLVAPDSYAAVFGPDYVAPYAAFGTFVREELAVGKSKLTIAIATPGLDRDRARIRDWVSAAARAVSSYFGRLPADRVLVLVVETRRGVHGKQMGDGQASVLLQIAPGADLADPEVDWMAAHELVHLTAPDLPRRQLWLSEGLATYVEPLARAEIGEVSPARVWGELVSGLPKGLPGSGDRGFDRDTSWGTTYWGGALFFLEADLQIRRLTAGKKSLRSALRAVLDAGGDARETWPVDRFLDVADRSSGHPVLRDLYRQMGLARRDVDLARLWRDLGVRVEGRRVIFDDQAPEAALRRAIAGPAR
jgi:hypothetical protein